MSKKNSSKIGKITSKSLSSYSVVEKQADNRLKDYQPKEQSDFEFVKGKLLFRSKDVGPLLRKLYLEQPHSLAAFAKSMDAFRKNAIKPKLFLSKVLSRERVFSDEEKSSLSAQVDAYLQKIADYLKQRFEQSQDGIHLFVDENEHLILNSVNLTVLLQNSHNKLSDPQKMYLKSLTQKLELALEKPKYNRPDSKIFQLIQSHLNAFLNLCSM